MKGWSSPMVETVGCSAPGRCLDRANIASRRFSYYPFNRSLCANPLTVRRADIFPDDLHLRMSLFANHWSVLLPLFTARHRLCRASAAATPSRGKRIFGEALEAAYPIMSRTWSDCPVGCSMAKSPQLIRHLCRSGLWDI